MRKCLIMLVIMTCLLSLSFQQKVSERKLDKFFDCLKTEGIADVSGFLLDVYYGRHSSNNFMSKFLEWYIRIDTSVLQMCIPLLEDKTVFVKSVFSKIGLSLLYASNCEKDLGPCFLILDNVIANFENIKKQWVDALVSSLTLGFAGFQSFKDCKAAVENIIEIWK